MKVNYKLQRIANYIYNYDLYESRDADATPESIADDIEKHPLDVINYLIDIIDDLTA